MKAPKKVNTSNENPGASNTKNQSEHVYNPRKPRRKFKLKKHITHEKTNNARKAPQT